MTEEGRERIAEEYGEGHAEFEWWVVTWEMRSECEKRQQRETEEKIGR